MKHVPRRFLLHPRGSGTTWDEIVALMRLCWVSDPSLRPGPASAVAWGGGCESCKRVRVCLIESFERLLVLDPPLPPSPLATAAEALAAVLEHVVDDATHTVERDASLQADEGTM